MAAHADSAGHNMDLDDEAAAEATRMNYAQLKRYMVSAGVPKQTVQQAPSKIVLLAMADNYGIVVPYEVPPEALDARNTAAPGAIAAVLEGGAAKGRGGGGVTPKDAAERKARLQAKKQERLAKEEAARRDEAQKVAERKAAAARLKT